MKILFSSKCLEYQQPGHPESPERVRVVCNFLKNKKFDFIEPKTCSEKDILLVHTKNLLEKVKSGDFFDFDTPNFPKIYDYAKLAAGSAIAASDTSFNEFTFSLMRPPGHHTGKNFLGGFCYFNNMAISIMRLLENKKIKKAVIIDIDCHHGNGTQDIFLGDERVLYVSLHQSPLYPGTGLTSEKNCLNYPLPPGADEKAYFVAFKKVIDQVKQFNPDLIGVSAGFDTYKKELIANLQLEVETYFKIGKMIANLKKPTFAVLEGGYTKDMPLCIFEFLQGIQAV